MIAGCNGASSGGSDTVDCQTQPVAHGDGDLLDGGAMMTVADGDVRLAVPLAVENVRTQNVAALEVYGMAGALAHVIPVSTDDAELMANQGGVGEGQPPTNSISASDRLTGSTASTHSRRAARLWTR